MWARHCRCCALHVRSALPPPGPPALPEAPRSTSLRALHATGQIMWRPHWAPARQWPPIAALSGPRRCPRCPVPARGQHMSSHLIPETTRRATLWFVVVRLHREPKHRGARACRLDAPAPLACAQRYPSQHCPVRSSTLLGWELGICWLAYWQTAVHAAGWPPQVCDLSLAGDCKSAHGFHPRFQFHLALEIFSRFHGNDLSTKREETNGILEIDPFVRVSTHVV